MKKLPYKEGDWFALPLPNGGYAVGVIARTNRGISLGYFFGPRHKKLPIIEDVKNYSPDEAIDVHMFGDMGLLNNEWVIIGTLQDWEREKWPMPKFKTKDPLRGKTFVVEYDKDNPVKEVNRSVVTNLDKVDNYPDDGLSGHKAVESYLEKLITKKESRI